jgi:hypothetical protein
MTYIVVASICHSHEILAARVGFHRDQTITDSDTATGGSGNPYTFVMTNDTNVAQASSIDTLRLLVR